ncbi:MAG: SIR2 family protein [Methanosarcinaceae archaeon]
MSTDIKKNLVDHFNRNSSSPFLFIGSGLSRRYLGLEDWEGLLKKFCEGLGDYQYYYSTASGCLPEVATSMSKDFHDFWWKSGKYLEDRERYKHLSVNPSSALKIAISSYLKELSNSECSNAQYAEEIEALSKLDVEGIITTNWDLFLEKLFPDYKVYVGQRELIFSNPQSIGEIYKIHGCCSEPNSMVLTSSDYEEFNSKNAYLAAKLITLFVEHPIIFIGYSIEDDNIRSLLTSIVNCLSPSDTGKIRNNLIFIKRNKNEAEDGISDDNLYFGKITIPIKVVTASNFTPIYEAIAETKRKIPTRVLRYCKEQLYELIKDKNPEKKLYVLDYQDVENKKDIEFVVGLGAIEKVSSKGYTSLTYEDIFSFYLNGGSYNTRLVLKNTIPQLSKRTPYLPTYKFMREVGINSKEDYESSEYDFDKVVNLDPEKYKVKNYKSQFENNAKGKTLEEIINEFPAEKVLMFVPFMDRSLIDQNILKNFLIEKAHLIKNQAHSSNYKKLVCFYDLLVYGWN